MTFLDTARFECCTVSAHFCVYRLYCCVYTMFCVQIVRLLVSYGADVNAVNDVMNTALHVACQMPQLYVTAVYLVMVCNHQCLSVCLFVCLSVCVFVCLCFSFCLPSYRELLGTHVVYIKCYHQDSIPPIYEMW